MKPLLCFDLDNTLVYSEKVHINSYNYALKKFLNKTQNSEFIIKLLGRPHEQIVKILTKDAPKDKIKDIMNLHDKILIKKFYHLAKPIKGIIETLKVLKNNFTLAIVSNCSNKNIKAILKGAKIPLNLFSTIIGYDEVKNSKPSPDMILKAERKLKTKAVYMVGDSPYDLIAGKRAKIKSIAVLTGHYSKTLLEKENPYVILKSVNELSEFIKGYLTTL